MSLRVVWIGRFDVALEELLERSFLEWPIERLGKPPPKLLRPKRPSTRVLERKESEWPVRLTRIHKSFSCVFDGIFHDTKVALDARGLTENIFSAMIGDLSRREREIVEALYTMGEGSARDVAEALREPQAYDTIRVTLGILEKRGHLKHRADGRQHIYSPVQPKTEASKSAWRRLTRIFFGGSPGRALISFLDSSGDRIHDDELEELSKWVDEQTRKRKKR